MIENQKIEIEINEFIKLKSDSEKLSNILYLIFNNTRLGYEDRLRIDEDSDLMTYLSIVEERKYRLSKDELLKKKESEE